MNEALKKCRDVSHFVKGSSGDDGLCKGNITLRTRVLAIWKYFIEISLTWMNFMKLEGGKNL